MDSQTQPKQPLHSQRYAYTTISTAPPKWRAGRTKFRETRHPVYKGVRQRGNNGERWVCEVRDPNNNKSRIWLGTFPTAEMAARAHDVAAMALRGRKACLNFADSAWRLAVPDSAGHKDIRQAAVVAAEMFRPSAAAAAAATDIADEEQEQSLSSESLESSSESVELWELDAEKLSSSTTTSTRQVAVELGSLLDAVEFGREYYWETSLTEPFRSGYCWDDISDYVADVPLWSYSI